MGHTFRKVPVQRVFGSAGMAPIGYSDPQLACLWFILLKKEHKLQPSVMLFHVLPLGGSYRYRILRQKLSLDRGAHLGLEGGGLGRHAAAVSVAATLRLSSPLFKMEAKLQPVSSSPQRLG